MRDPHRELIPAGPGHECVRRFLQLRRTPGRHAGTIEGLGVLEAALDHGADVEAVLACPELFRSGRAPTMLRRLVESGAPGFRVSPRTFARLSGRGAGDGLAAIVRVGATRLDDVAVAATARVLVLDRLELPGNVGSLIRTASAVGATAVLVVGQGARLAHPLVLRSSVGAVFSVPVASVSEPEAVAWLRRHGFQVVATDPAALGSYRDVAYGRRVAVVVGSERFGLSGCWREYADLLVAIRMRGRVDSLNAGHAGAIVLFEVAHQHEAG